jgi:TBP-interacting protein
MVEIKEVPTAKTRFERIGAHTHIKGLGLNSKLKAIKVKDGMVGQEKAREAARLVVQLIKDSGQPDILFGE